MKKLQHITVGLTGASGMPYALRLLECLKQQPLFISVVVSPAAQMVAAIESGLILPSKTQALQAFFDDRYPTGEGKIKVWGQQEWTAPIASGSGCADQMVVCPCTSGSLAAIAHGNSNNLLERAADVMLKERKPLILVLRETPLSIIHLQNCLMLANAGAVIMPAAPGFYHEPKTIADLVDFIVARVLEHLHLPQNLCSRWGAESTDSA